MTGIDFHPNFWNEGFERTCHPHSMSGDVSFRYCTIVVWVHFSRAGQTLILRPINTCLRKCSSYSLTLLFATAAQLPVHTPQVKDSLVPWLNDVNTRTQTAASLVMIAAHVVLHSSPGAVQQEMLRLLFPATLPYLTSHHHNLRTFTQVSVSVISCGVNGRTLFAPRLTHTCLIYPAITYSYCLHIIAQVELCALVSECKNPRMFQVCSPAECLTS